MCTLPDLLRAVDELVPDPSPGGRARAIDDLMSQFGLHTPSRARSILPDGGQRLSDGQAIAAARRLVASLVIDTMPGPDAAPPRQYRPHPTRRRRRR